MRMSIKPAIKKKLVDFGVPPEKHDAASLVSLFPPEFMVTGTSMSAPEIAEVFVTFVEHGLINAPSAVVRRAQSSHVCHFYRSDEDSLCVSAEFLEEGLRGGERCLWIPPAWISIDRARAAFAEVRPTVADAERAGRLAFYTDDQVHVDERGRMRDGAAIIRFWLEEEQKALAQGFRGLRIAGDGTAIVVNEGWEAGVDYERDCDRAFRGRRIAALCSYSVKDVPVERLARVLSGHAGVTGPGAGRAGLRAGLGTAAAGELLRGR
jgi:hypothetical protein